MHDDHHDEDERYCIVRFYFNGGSEVTQVGLTREEAQAHCNRPDTKGDGWFDGFDTEANRPHGVAAFEAEQEAYR